MTAITRMTAKPPVNAYAPGAISEITVEAVDKIGQATAAQIEHTAETIEAGAKELGDRLRKLAGAMREHTRLASQDVSEFCLKMASARATIRGLEVEITDKVVPEIAAIGHDDGEPSPAFLHSTDAAGKQNGATQG